MIPLSAWHVSRFMPVILNQLQIVYVESLSIIDVVFKPPTEHWEFWADTGIRQSWKLTMIASCFQSSLYSWRVQSRRVVEVAFNCLIANWAVVHWRTLTAMHAIYSFTCFSTNIADNVPPYIVSFITESVWERLGFGQTLTITLLNLCSFWSLGTV